MTSSSVNMVALVEHLAKALVDSPDEVEVEAFDESGQTVLELFVAERIWEELSVARGAWRAACARS